MGLIPVAPENKYNTPNVGAPSTMARTMTPNPDAPGPGFNPFNPLSQENPLSWQTYFPKDVYDQGRSSSDMVNQAMSRGLEGSDYTSKTLNYGAGDKVNTNEQMPSQYGSPMEKALQARSSRQSEQQLANIRAQQGAAIPEMESNEARRAGNMIASIQQNKMQNFKEQYAYQVQRAQIYNQWLTAKSQATAGFLGSIFGTVGMIGAAAI